MRELGRGHEGACERGRGGERGRGYEGMSVREVEGMGERGRGHEGVGASEVEASGEVEGMGVLSKSLESSGVKYDRQPPAPP